MLPQPPRVRTEQPALPLGVDREPDMNSVVKVALVGIAGYGDAYLTALLQQQQQEQAGAPKTFELVGAVDPMPHRCRHLDELRMRRVKIHPDLSSLYADSKPDLVMMA